MKLFELFYFLLENFLLCEHLISLFGQKNLLKDSFEKLKVQIETRNIFGTKVGILRKNKTKGLDEAKLWVVKRNVFTSQMFSGVDFLKWLLNFYL